MPAEVLKGLNLSTNCSLILQYGMIKLFFNNDNEEFCSKEIYSSITKHKIQAVVSFSLHPTFMDSRYYEHQMTALKVYMYTADV